MTLAQGWLLYYGTAYSEGGYAGRQFYSAKTQHSVRSVTEWRACVEIDCVGPPASHGIAYWVL